jgi:hypothetical protein
MRRIGQLLRMGIGAVTDDERHPLVRKSRRAAKPARDQQQESDPEKCAHRKSPIMQTGLRKILGACL